MIELTKVSDYSYNVKIYNNPDMGKIEPLEDGYYYYWPVLRPGCWSSSMMREIADKLDELNEPWDKQVMEYHEQEES